MTTRSFDKAPSTAPLMLKAVLPAIPVIGGLPGIKHGSSTVPDLVLERRGVGTDPKHLETYNEVCEFGPRRHPAGHLPAHGGVRAAHDADDRHRVPVRPDGPGAPAQPHHAAPSDRGRRDLRRLGDGGRPPPAPQGTPRRPAHDRQHRRRRRVGGGHHAVLARTRRRQGDDSPRRWPVSRRPTASCTGSSRATSAVATAPCRATATPSTSTRSRRRRSGSRATSPTACGPRRARWPRCRTSCRTAFTIDVEFKKPILLPEHGRVRQPHRRRRHHAGRHERPQAVDRISSAASRRHDVRRPA